jgi:two-component system, chemotaxis family, sensor kinase CheA
MFYPRPLRSVMAVARRAVDVWVPPRLASDPESRRRAQLVVGVVLTIFVVSVLMIGKYSSEGSVELRNRELLMFPLQALSLLTLRFTGSYRAAGHVLCGVMWFVFFNLASLTGGFEAPNLVSNIVIVFMAAMLCGPRGGIAWLVIVIATFVAHSLLSAKGIFDRQTLSVEAVRETRLAELIATSVCATLVAYLYETGKQRMLVALSHEKSELERAHRDIGLILDSTGQGFLSIDPESRVIGERSAVAERWLGKPRERERFHDLLARHGAGFAGMFEAGWVALRQGYLPLELCIDQLPKRLRVSGMTLAFEYRPTMNRSGALEQTVIVISDITAQVASEKAEMRQRDMLAMFNRIVKDRDGFIAFVADATATAKRIHAGALTGPDLARALHTLKGNAGMMEIAGLATLCHRLEDELQDSCGDLTTASAEGLVDEVKQAEDLVAHFSVERDLEEITLTPDQYRSFLRRLEGSRDHRLAAEVQLWCLQPVSRELERLADHARALSVRLDKGHLQVTIEDSGLRFEPSEQWRRFWPGLVHVVRNAIDHGLEGPAGRLEAGKGGPELALRAALSSSELVIEIVDDGRGIDWKHVGERARQQGLPHACHDDLVEAIFADGMSTRETISEVSGRGIGMGEVRSACRALGGRIEIVSTPGKGTTFRFAFSRAGLQVGAVAGLGAAGRDRRLSEAAPSN